MPADKALRQLTLLLLLQSRTSPISRADIFEQMVDYYPDGDEARERMFERDKADLRSLGVVLEAVEDAFLEDFIGYRVNYGATQEHRVHFTPDEAYAVSIAAKLWHGTGLENSVGDAALRVQALSDPLSESALVRRVDLAALPEAVASLTEAVRRRRTVAFGYRKPDSAEPEQRQVQPWAVIAQGGHWHLVGHDVVRDQKRQFRLDRIATAVTPLGPDEAFSPPAGFDVNSELDRHALDDAAAVVRVRRDRCWTIRRAADSVEAAGDDWDVCTITGMSEPALAGLTASHAPDAVPVTPPTLVANVKHILTCAADGPDHAG